MPTGSLTFEISLCKYNDDGSATPELNGYIVNNTGRYWKSARFNIESTDPEVIFQISIAELSIGKKRITYPIRGFLQGFADCENPPLLDVTFADGEYKYYDASHNAIKVPPAAGCARRSNPGAAVLLHTRPRERYAL
jgi:hypothetical protein